MAAANSRIAACPLGPSAFHSFFRIVKYGFHFTFGLNTGAESLISILWLLQPLRWRRHGAYCCAHQQHGQPFPLGHMTTASASRPSKLPLWCRMLSRALVMLAALAFGVNGQVHCLSSFLAAFSLLTTGATHTLGHSPNGSILRCSSSGNRSARKSIMSSAASCQASI